MADIEFIPFTRRPATEPFSHDGRTFSAAQLNIIGDALAAGVFYQDALRDHCRDAWIADCPAVDHRITRDDGDGIELLPENFQQGRARLSEVEAELKTLPRGSWAFFGRPYVSEDGRQWRGLEMSISVGDGSIYRVQTSRFNASTAPMPDFAVAHADMVSMDIYLARQAEEERTKRDLSRHLIQQHGLRAGMQLRDVELGGERFSSATVTEVRPTGYLKLVLTKRGSKRRWEYAGLAQSIRSRELTHAPVTRDLLFAAAA
ncbi:hypothetical protein [Luteimonas sp. MHLX1A]|uniref:hypothetical protein n=1 Tax=Alterluteimonas muca TaxID=2878684 RepID=UPI001E534B50|nr:hypothetical protein [Luteimonas sp. MHLX1A]MCD9046785.1 hypothetical protein [Luteimonas sp. MHLX1A]